jgi:hypothetical protein
MTTKESLKWLGRVSLSGIFWVFLLSIRVEGKTLFSYANSFFVQNSFLHLMDGVSDTLFKLSDKARVTFSDDVPKPKGSGDDKI